MMGQYSCCQVGNLKPKVGLLRCHFCPLKESGLSLSDLLVFSDLQLFLLFLAFSLSVEALTAFIEDESEHR